MSTILTSTGTELLCFVERIPKRVKVVTIRSPRPPCCICVTAVFFCIGRGFLRYKGVNLSFVGFLQSSGVIVFGTALVSLMDAFTQEVYSEDTGVTATQYIVIATIMCIVITVGTCIAYVDRDERYYALRWKTTDPTIAPITIQNNSHNIPPVAPIDTPIPKLKFTLFHSVLDLLLQSVLCGLWLITTSPTFLTTINTRYRHPYSKTTYMIESLIRSSLLVGLPFGTHFMYGLISHLDSREKKVVMGLNYN